nr:LLM class flavin-dependent oxidoreductase [Chloroflexota bacterium]
PLVAHVVVALSTDEATVQAQARPFLQRYAQLPFYAHMFQEAGLPVASDGSGLDALAQALVISGDEATVGGRLAELLANGLDEVMVHPLPLSNDGKAREQLLQCLTALA